MDTRQMLSDEQVMNKYREDFKLSNSLWFISEYKLDLKEVIGDGHEPDSKIIKRIHRLCEKRYNELHPFRVEDLPF